MNKKTIHLICSAALAAAALTVIPSCGDSEDGKPQPAATGAQEKSAAEESSAPSAEAVLAMMKEQLGDCAFAELGELRVDQPSGNEDGSLQMTAHLPLAVKEDIFTRENAPAAFNDERKAVNESLNQCMLPESVYLMQVGASTDMITDEDRAAKPLPADLQTLANELKELAEASVYRSIALAGQTVELHASFKAVRKDGQWELSDVVVDNSALLPLEAGVMRSALPEGASVLTPDFEETRKSEIREKIAAFNEAAKPYVAGREDAARATYAEHRARVEEEMKQAREQAEAEAKIQKEWADRCARFVAGGKSFSGEWTRGNRFGEITLSIARAQRLDSSIQFYGSIFDTKLPAASLDIAGRCDLSQSGDGAHIDVTIYDGQYDPDEPTAEVYDSSDGVIVLKLAADGRMEGVMSCISWKDNPDKAFKLRLQPVKEKESSKKSSRRR